MATEYAVAIHQCFRRKPVLALVAGSLAGLCFSAGFAQQPGIDFDLLPREIIESRLRSFTRNNDARKTQLKLMLEEAGCDGDRLKEQPVRRPKLPNLICTLPGGSDATIVVGAHFDHTDAGLGVVDNWSGAALLPSLYQSLRAKGRKHTFVFVGFTEEEQGLVGSSYYVQNLSSEQVAKLRAMINLDSLGLGPTKVWLNHSDMNLSRHMERLAFTMRFPFAVVNGDRVGDDDSTPFKKRGVPTLMLHSITQDTLSILHTARDRMDKIALGDYYASYNQIAAYLAYIDAILD